ncbi:MAG: hypothetical protein ACD_81C00089G0012 [uncultured bacterium]|uniref:Polysaccharide deacetylase n=1 Tax=Candidatus Wolfebacteria bacterium GW2011_GWE2_44_13 TaxID=1619017 RepID=A0A0G1HAG7_9BACT|nr:MAG: hypothetical protein ACD_81C00089G0012 [uncultured bacterium]KKT43543.1 MAG: hypothetical protein UW32_C0001G0135 [Candidatus Wolfebacteria bacterium GW2011_GWE2_44_13]
MNYSIRDDDVSYWTDVAQLESVYGQLLKEGAKISFAVVPFAYQVFNNGDWDAFYFGNERKYVYENKALVTWLLFWIEKGQIEIMQHGFDHAYYVALPDGAVRFLDISIRETIHKEKLLVRYIPEFLHKEFVVAREDIALGKKILEDAFKVTASVFVPPSNSISASSARALAMAGLNMSGMIGLNFNRPFSFSALKNYVTKIVWRLYNAIPYPFVMRYSAHKELAAFSFTSADRTDALHAAYAIAAHKNAPFVLAVHYWELFENEALRNAFNAFLSDKQRNSIFLSEYFK